MTAAVVFAVVFIALYVGHHLGDQWVQTHAQACGKGERSRAGQLHCLAHVATLTATKVLTLTLAAMVTHLPLSPGLVVLALTVDAVSHYWADRRYTLAALADRLGKTGYYRLGMPREGHDDNPSVGTGSFHLDQSWHLTWIFAATLIITAGAPV
ncbi:DUF3307 domain-containing protein [Nonomuraea rhodomycinica]|uniref:DUF3307 domain-containing protein n=1 Tax=Nonomuraea rhodomycinica TaxID=1712872 RepID=A0A7Y6IZW1_9ACTN|nr:DUF3307 domain-containing protein [Nonomuraea rhodomycinica]NUW46988.1 DUF3307 domain-containing protein [Nonomuraea rhodomycinica]